MHRRQPHLKQNRSSLYSSLQSSNQGAQALNSNDNAADKSFDAYDDDYDDYDSVAYAEDDDYTDHPSTYGSSSMFDRLRIQLEICFENIMDSVGLFGDSMRKPLLILASFALIMTLKAGKQGIRGMKGVTRSAYSPYGAAQPYGAQPYGAARTAYGAATTPGARSRGAAQPYGGAQPYNAAQRNTMQSRPNTYGAQQPINNYNNGVAPAPGGLNGVAGLVDMHGASLHVLQPGLMKDYGAVTDFQGQVETLHGFESAANVEQVLNQPGQNRVLVVDGGGDLRAAIFDANMASAAQRNGWRGVIIHGAVRNARQLATMQIGVKAIGTSPVRGQAQQGQQSAALSFGGLQVNPGYWIYADKDGIVISEREISGAALSGGTNMGSGYVGAQPQQPNTYGTQPNAMRGTAAAQPYVPRTPVGAAVQQYGANTAGGYNRPAPVQSAYGRNGPTTAGRTYAYNTGGQRNSKKFLGKFVGMCFLFTSFMLMIKSVQGDDY